MCKCKVSWCNNKTKKGKKGRYLIYCDRKGSK